MKKSTVLIFAFFVCVASILTSCSAAGCPGYWRGNTVSPKAFRAKSAYKAPVQEKITTVKEVNL